MKRLRRSEAGVLDYPYRLLIIAAVMALVIPAMISLANRFKTEAAVEHLEQQVNKISENVESVYVEGVGARTNFEVDFPGQTEYVEIGGPLNVSGSPAEQFHRDKIFYKVEDDPTVYKKRVTHGLQGIPMKSPRNATVIVADGNYQFTLVKRAASVDINQDGYPHNDFYVEVNATQSM